MIEVKLRNKTVTVDISSLTVSEWRQFISPTGTVKQENDVVTKCTGLTSEEIGKLNLREEFQPLVQAIIRASREPLANPNSQGASTSQE